MWALNRPGSRDYIFSLIIENRKSRKGLLNAFRDTLIEVAVVFLSIRIPKQNNTINCPQRSLVSVSSSFMTSSRASILLHNNMMSGRKRESCLLKVDRHYFCSFQILDMTFLNERGSRESDIPTCGQTPPKTRPNRLKTIHTSTESN